MSEGPPAPPHTASMMAPPISLFLLAAEGRPAAAHFLADLNPLPEHQICYLGLAEGEIAAEMSVVLPPEGYSLAAQDETGRMIGFLGVEMDPALGRAWLFGPLVEAHDWHDLADQLYQAAREHLPPEIVDQELCGRLDNTRLAEFARRHGFTAGTPAALLYLPRPSQPTSQTNASEQGARLSQAPPGPGQQTVSAGLVASQQSALKTEHPDPADPDVGQLDSLHNQLFPSTYYSAAQLIAMSAEPDKRLQIELADGQLAGYIFLRARPASKDTYIDFLGVAEPYRRRSIARRLLTGALNWAFALPFVEEVTLTVHTTNTAALALYKDAGFRLRHVMVGYRKRPS